LKKKVIPAKDRSVCISMKKVTWPILSLVIHPVNKEQSRYPLLSLQKAQIPKVQKKTLICQIFLSRVPTRAKVNTLRDPPLLLNRPRNIDHR
jgi:hypothetical protein